MDPSFWHTRRTLILIRTGRLPRARYRHATTTVKLAGHIINEVSAAMMRNFRRPIVAVGPCGPLLENGTGNSPVDQIARVQNRKLRRPARRGRSGPIILANAYHGRVGIITSEDGVRVANVGDRKFGTPFQAHGFHRSGSSRRRCSVSICEHGGCCTDPILSHGSRYKSRKQRCCEQRTPWLRRNRGGPKRCRAYHADPLPNIHLAASVVFL